MKEELNNQFHPVATSEEEVIDLLKSDTVRAVMYRNQEKEWQQDMARVRAGITFEDNPSLALQYHADSNFFRRRIETGQQLYLRALSCEDILRESANAAITIDPEAIDIITRRTNEVGEICLRVLHAYAGERERETQFCRVLMTPKGGVGRTPLVHTDAVPLAAHCTFDGASLYMVDGVISDTTWYMINKLQLTAVSEKVCEQVVGQRMDIGINNVEYTHSQLGDVVFKKGAIGRNMNSSEERKDVCPHASSPDIVDYGQAAVVISSKELG